MFFRYCRNSVVGPYRENLSRAFHCIEKTKNRNFHTVYWQLHSNWYRSKNNAWMRIAFILIIKDCLFQTLILYFKKKSECIIAIISIIYSFTHVKYSDISAAIYYMKNNLSRGEKSFSEKSIWKIRITYNFVIFIY